MSTNILTWSEDAVRLTNRLCLMCWCHILNETQVITAPQDKV